MPATPRPGSYPPLVITPRVAGNMLEQRFLGLGFGYFFERRAHRVPGARSDRFQVFQWHNVYPRAYSPSIRLIRSPVFKVTTAFFVSGNFLTRGPYLFRLP